MKKVAYILMLGLLVLVSSCSNNTYSDLRKKEDKLIANYISRNNLNILTAEPANDVWGEKDYLRVPGYDNFYFHLYHRGDSILVDSETNDTIDQKIEANALVVVRYKRFALTENADTLRNWSTLDDPYPYEFHYMNTNDCEAIGWHIAVQYMKYPETECCIIQPSKMGFSEEQNSVTPYGYIMKIKVKN